MIGDTSADDTLAYDQNSRHQRLTIGVLAEGRCILRRHTDRMHALLGQCRVVNNQPGIVKAVLPGMRARRRGHIVNISSIGGLLGVSVTVVAPGAFRTDFRGPTSIKQSARRIDDYAETAGKSRAGTQAGHGKQAGDPARGARAIITAVEAERPPVQVLIGGDALDKLRGKLDDMRRETDLWEEVTRSTDIQSGMGSGGFHS